MPTSVALPASHQFQPSLSLVVSLSLGVFGLERMDETEDAERAIFGPPPEGWGAAGAAAPNFDEEHSL